MGAILELRLAPNTLTLFKAPSKKSIHLPYVQVFFFHVYVTWYCSHQRLQEVTTPSQDTTPTFNWIKKEPPFFFC